MDLFEGDPTINGWHLLDKNGINSYLRINEQKDKFIYKAKCDEKYYNKILNVLLDQVQGK